MVNFAKTESASLTNGYCLRLGKGAKKEPKSLSCLHFIAFRYLRLAIAVRYEESDVKGLPCSSVVLYYLVVLYRPWSDH